MNRNQNAYDHIRAYIKTVAPSMRYNGGDPALHRATLKAKLIELLGLDLIERQSDDLFALDYTLDRGDYVETRFTFQTETGCFCPCVLRVPTGVEKPPLAICLQGHSTGMHISLGVPKFAGDADSIAGGDRDFCVRAVKEGYAALAVEQRCFGECGGTEKGPDCKSTAMDMLLVGRTLIGSRVWDISRVIDLMLRRFPSLDYDNILCMGNSGGGTATFYAACVDERVSAAMPSCAFCAYDASIAAMEHCPCNYIPSSRRYFDMGDLTALIAPRKLIIVCGKDDPIFPLPGVKAAYAEAERMFELYGDTRSLRLVIGEGGHRFYADLGWKEVKSL